MDPAIFRPWLARWRLTPDGPPIVGTWAKLLPVRHAGGPAMLKVDITAEEARGADLLAWWDGDGAVRLLERDRDALLMERVDGGCSLADWADAGDDEAALATLCDAAARLHAPRPTPPPASLTSLAERFAPLRSAAEAPGSLFARGWMEANVLLAAPQALRPLHGDLWHDNLRDAGERGWLAIDPVGLLGERAYDYAIMVGNPDFPKGAAEPERLLRRARFVARRADLQLSTLLRAMVVEASLYAARSLRRREKPRALEVAEIAAQALDAVGRGRP